MNSFAPLVSQIVDSSLWEEAYYVRILFTTMLAKKDFDHVVRGTAYNLHRWANITQEECLEGLMILSSPDAKRLDKQEHDGRRIEKVDGGWLILNGAKYEALMREIAERVRKAKWARANRARLKNGSGGGDDADLGCEVGTGEIGQADIKDYAEGKRLLRKNSEGA